MAHNNNICFITLYIGEDINVNIPELPLPGHSYFITNKKELVPNLKNKGWLPVLVHIPAIYTEDVIEKQIFYTAQCKKYRVFPQRYIQKQYNYIVWFDNKFNVNVSGTYKTINKPLTNAVALHKHIFIENITGEFKKCIKYQERYNRQKEQYIKYINEQIKSGLSKEYKKHYQVGYVIYNMLHPKIHEIQNSWMEHIEKCGINDQISFNFIAQIYPDIIEEYIYNYRDDRSKYILGL